MSIRFIEFSFSLVGKVVKVDHQVDNVDKMVGSPKSLVPARMPLSLLSSASCLLSRSWFISCHNSDDSKTGNGGTDYCSRNHLCCYLPSNKTPSLNLYKRFWIEIKLTPSFIPCSLSNISFSLLQDRASPGKVLSKKSSQNLVGQLWHWCLVMEPIRQWFSWTQWTLWILTNLNLPPIQYTRSAI